MSDTTDKTSTLLTHAMVMARLIEGAKQASSLAAKAPQERVAVRSPLGGYEMEIRTVQMSQLAL